MALFAVVYGSMAGPATYTRLAEELGRLGQRTLLVELPVDRPQLTGTDYARLVAEQLDAGQTDATTDEPVMVVAHSASGLLLPLVPSFRPVAHLVYLALRGGDRPLGDRHPDPLVSRGPVSGTVPTGGVPAGPQHLDHLHRGSGHPAGLVAAGRQRPAGCPSGRAARWPLPPRVPPGAAG